MRYLLAAAVATTLLVPTLADAGAPRLAVTDRSPLTIRGVGFAAGERVRVVVAHDGTTTRWTATNRVGAFTVRLPMTIAPCSAFIVRAFGRRGDVATLQVRPPECPPPATP